MSLTLKGVGRFIYIECILNEFIDWCIIFVSYVLLSVTHTSSVSQDSA